MNTNAKTPKSALSHRELASKHAYKSARCLDVVNGAEDSPTAREDAAFILQLALVHSNLAVYHQTVANGDDLQRTFDSRPNAD